jgi:hypothetical protein
MPNIFNKISKEYSIVTLPRVGSHYLQDRIVQHTGVYIKRSHIVMNNKMITIVRDPVDMITSKLAMTAFYDKDNKTINHIRNNKENTEDLNLYIDSLNKADIDKNLYIFINYEDLIKYPFDTVKTLSNIINLSITNKNYKEGMISDIKENSHLLSSKKVENYKEIRSYVESLDLSNFYQFYNKTLDKCINIL